MAKAKRERKSEAAAKRRQRSRVAAESPADDDRPVVALVSLGCVKNLVDSERMLAQIAESGAMISFDESAADTVVVNTCGFLDVARQEALDVIRGLAERKRAEDLRRLVVVGCLVQRDGEALLAAVPEIDALVGVHNRDDVAAAIWQRAGDDAVDCYLGEYHAQPWTDRGRLRLTPGHYAYIRVSEGCNQRCTFCTIPSIRGPMRCKTPDAIVAECGELMEDGARELILIGQDTTAYGRDIAYEPGLAGLLRQLDRECADARWIRLMYAYPSVFTDAMIDAIAECERVVKYVDIPLQHINDHVLRGMGRRVTRRQTEQLLEKLRRRIPGVTIRTTFIVGFPGETASEFEELVEFVRDSGFDAVGAFPYSQEPDTPAGRMSGQLEDAVKDERYERLMLAQQELAFAAARRRVGQRLPVVVDGSTEAGMIARHAGQAPDVDPVCWIVGEGLSPGEAVSARCVDTDGYDLIVRADRERLSVV